MLYALIAIAAVAAALAVLLVLEDRKNSKLLVENGFLKGRSDALAQPAAAGAAQPAPLTPLTKESIAEAVRFVGYVPDIQDEWVVFKASGDTFLIGTERLPAVFLLCDFNVDTDAWEMDLLRHAAHLMSDELIIIKALFNEDEDGQTGIRFSVTALDRNYESFRENLVRYIGLINEGRGKMHEIYEKLVKEKREEALRVTPFLPTQDPEKKVVS